ncbi:uncharacterized protein LOC126320761 [Schistocerca gregaria]|uniref:uncharacterized protein LOC126320761 n=1 Tax=Schistocerca gregaria TaxID=7010 RepID=UPI00211E811D|nr:uncharacterized protein LOC126320761 [Schistocerca gregaria]
MDDQHARDQQQLNQHRQAIYLAALQQQQLHAQLQAHQQTIMQLQAIAHHNQNSNYTAISPGEYTQESLSNKKLSEIKEILKQTGKKVTGNKEDLIARILGLEEPGAGSSPRTSAKKRKSDDIRDDSEEYEEEEDMGGSPKFKKPRIDKNDPVMLECFLCHSREDLVKYKDIRQCIKCKHLWKGRRLLEEEACQMFALEPEDLAKLPHKEQTSQSSDAPSTPLYAFATAAGAAVKKYGSLYNMIKENQAQREMLAQYLQQQHLHQHALLQQQLLQQQYQHSGMMMSSDELMHHVQQQQMSNPESGGIHSSDPSIACHNPCDIPQEHMMHHHVQSIDNGAMVQEHSEAINGNPEAMSHLESKQSAPICDRHLLSQSHPQHIGMHSEEQHMKGSDRDLSNCGENDNFEMERTGMDGSDRALIDRSPGPAVARDYGAISH